MNDAYGHRWLSEPAETLIDEVGRAGESALHCDVLIVGSGYGGAVAAARLAGARDAAGGRAISVCLLERGNEFLPGMFPATFAELPGQVRFSMQDGRPARGRRDGLYDMRLGGDVNALVANGLGGGSLINAAVMERPTADAFADTHWPAGLNLTSLDEAYRKAEAMLAPQTIPGSVPKLDSLLAAAHAMGASESRKAAVAITFRDATTPAGVAAKACLKCGDCVSGCNHHAKLSLDVNYLAAARAKGARLFCGGTVLRLAPRGTSMPGWRVDFMLTDPQKARRDRAAPYQVNARRVILAAGTFGSTEILLRSAKDLGLTGKALGSRFSGNGDLIAVAYKQKDKAPCSAREGDAPASRGIGPTITGLARVATAGQKRPIVIEEFGIPGPLRRLLGEVVATTDALQGLARIDRSRHRAGESMDDPLSVSDEALDRSPVYGLMGDDGARGLLQAIERLPGDEVCDGGLHVTWQDKPALNALFKAGIGALRQAHERPALLGGRGGHVLPNPMWQPLPPFKIVEDLGFNGPALTVHPLGGCPMADDAKQGVVDRFGRVYAATGGERPTLLGLAVLDGSIVPVALGINPALTIAALAEHAVPALAEDWQLNLDSGTATLAWPRPQRRDTQLPTPPAPTRFRLRERMSGTLNFGGREIEAAARVTFASFDAARFRRLPRELALDEVLLDFSTASGKAQARCRGRARVLCREPSSLADRVLRAGEPALRKLRSFAGGGDSSACGWADLIALTSHIGQVRLIEYRWEVIDADAGAPLCTGQHLTLTKRIEFTEGSNPWRQLSEGELVLHGHPDIALGRLALDFGFLAEQMTALIAIESQQDAPNAIGDLAELALWVLRIVLRTHLLNFLPPGDAQQSKGMGRLPGEVDGVTPVPHEVRFPDGRSPKSTAKFLLSRYTPQGRQAGLRPVLLIHGYGAGGSTFAHPKIGINLVQTLMSSGRDVWVLDLRTAIGHEQRRHWTFDEVALGDIPPALAKVLEARPDVDRVDVVAHCIGAAMFSVAALSNGTIAGQVGAVVLSQVGPLVQMSAFNRFRGFVASYLQHYLNAEVFDVRQPPGELRTLLIDALLATFPYPDGDGEAERLKTVPGFAAVRHRADAIFGRLMKLANIGDDLLPHLDAIYGWVMVKTLAQTIHYARERLLTDAGGMNQVVSFETIAHHFGFPVLMLHGRENAVFDWRGSEATVRLLARIFDGLDKNGELPVNGPRRLRVIEGYGHQDCLIGKDAHRDVFGHIVGFLDEFKAATPSTDKGSKPIAAELPWMGPTLGAVSLDPATHKLQCRLALRPPPARASAFAVVYVPARRDQSGAWQLVFDEAVADPTTRETLIGKALLPQLHAARLGDYAGFAVVTVHNDLPIFGERTVNGRALVGGLFALPALTPADEVAAEVKRCLSTASAAALDLAIVELHAGWIAAASGQPPQDSLTFALASCQYPAGIADSIPASQSHARLADRIAAEPAEHKPQLLLLLGDQVYVDDLAGLFNPAGEDDIERAYRTSFTLDAWQRSGKAVPVLPLLDDHEIRDNWEPDPARDDAKAFDAWRHYQHKLVRDDGEVPYDHQAAPAGMPLFLLDARSQRQARTLRPVQGATPLPEAVIHADADFARLRQWLRSVPAGRPKLIASSVSVFPFSRAALAGGSERIALDDWGGYPRSLLALLKLVAEEGARDVVLLSGDRHLSSVSSLWIDGRDGPLEVASVVASGSYAPWPFANVQPHELWLDGDFEFTLGAQSQRGQVGTAAVGTGNGFAIVGIQRAGSGAWRLRVELDLDDSLALCERTLGDAGDRRWAVRKVHRA